MTKLEFQELSEDQQYSEINDALLGNLMTAQEKRYFESKSRAQQLAEIWVAASNISGVAGGYHPITDILYIKSPNGHYWSIVIDNAGAITYTDIGTALP